MWIWALLSPERLGARAAEAIEDAENELWLSPISIWEALLFTDRGRIEVSGEAAGWIDQGLRALPVRDAPLTREVAIASRSIDLPHEDPADRFIAASAAIHGLVLVTADQELLDSDAYDTLRAH